MNQKGMSRRDLLKRTGISVAALAADPTISLAQEPKPAPSSVPDSETRMKWWHQAKFGMFVHWGLYSVLGRHEWVMENEGIPIAEYEPLARRFNPKPNAARDWARLAKRAGMKYMVMTTKHHEGFCHFDSKLTNYTSAKQGSGRDLVREYVDAARAEGLRVGFYYSLMDWHHPDGAKCATDEAARKRFVAYIHGQIRELLTNYGKIDVLWYDVSWPLDAKGWESEKMNDMVFELQPDIIVNNRNKLKGDFSTPEQRIEANKDGQAWESCMTMNDSWGYQAADDAWKSPKQVVRNLITCSHDSGNYLINIGPKADGSIPPESVQIMTAVGKWMARNGETIYKSESCQVRRSNYAGFTRRGNTLYMHVHFWPGSTVNLSGLKNKVLGVKLFAAGTPVKFTQDQFRLQMTGLPATAPDTPVTTLAIECDSVPEQDQNIIRRDRPRFSADISI